MVDTYCVIGDPIEHSLSPVIYNSLFELYRLRDLHYGAVQVSKASLPSFVQSLADKGVRGFNVTMPLKTQIKQYLAYTDEDAVYGVNTVVRENDELKGYSTDAQGFRRSIQLHDLTYAGSRITFLGCGGAGQALIADCLKHGPKRVVILNRTAAHCGAFAKQPGVTIDSLDAADKWMENTDILINATPLGMKGVGSEFPSLDFVNLLPNTAFVADLIYSPPQTRLLAAAEQRGLANMNGLWMLIWQAFFAFELYAGILPDMDAFSRLYDKLTSASG